MDDLMKYMPEPAPAPELPTPERRPRTSLFSGKALFFVACAACLALFLLYKFFISAPGAFPAGSTFKVGRGETLAGIAGSLEGSSIIRSPRSFELFVRLFAPHVGIKAGDYELDLPQNVVVLAWRLSRASYDLKLERVTIPEGLSSIEIAAIFSKNPKFASFDASAFKKAASGREGYLFPDTYFFLPNVTAGEVVAAMTANYDKRIKAVSADIQAFGRPEKDVIIMASIVEREARTEETRRTIAGILWKRLAEGMPLQVDAAFSFVNGKSDSKDLTLDDLAIDSPYNTYVRKGLPPGPIGNPGLAAIKAVVTPIATPYYFYLSDDQGVMHYAVTHDQHVANKDRYLR